MGDWSWLTEACCCVIPIPISIAALAVLIGPAPRRR
jgi:hypothetical protein